MANREILYSNYDYDLNPTYGTYSRYQKLGETFRINTDETKLKLVDEGDGAYINRVTTGDKTQRAVSTTTKNAITWGIMAPVEFAKAADDIYYVVEKPEEGRADKLAAKFYGNDGWRLYWAILWANQMYDPMQEIKAGITLRIPSYQNVLSRLT